MKRGADFAGERLVKVAKRTPHNGVEMREGRVEDPLPFDPDPTCGPGGIYFCRERDVGRWIDFYEDKAAAVFDVTLDDDEPVIEVGNDKLKSHAVTLSNRRSIWDNQELCLAAVQQKGCALQYVKEQTPEICLAAVRENGYALHYVNEQTPEICMASVQRSGYTLEYVENQTPDICLAAVQQNWWTLYNVKDQTPEICLAAVQQNGCALQYVKEQTHEICLAAVQRDGWALQYVREQTPEIYKA